MKEDRINTITELLFRPGEKCTELAHIARRILINEGSVSDKIWGALTLVNVAKGAAFVAGRPDEISFDFVKAVTAAMLVACQEDVHSMAGIIFRSCTGNVNLQLPARDGVVFGLLTGLPLVQLTSTGKCSYELSIQDIELSGDTAVLYCMLYLAWQQQEDDLMPPERAGELTNLIAEYVTNKSRGGYKSPVRVEALGNFFGRAAALLQQSEPYPSQLARTLVTSFMHQSLGILPEACQLEMMSAELLRAVGA